MGSVQPACPGGASREALSAAIRRDCQRRGSGCRRSWLSPVCRSRAPIGFPAVCASGLPRVRATPSHARRAATPDATVRDRGRLNGLFEALGRVGMACQARSRRRARASRPSGTCPYSRWESQRALDRTRAAPVEVVRARRTRPSSQCSPRGIAIAALICRSCTAAPCRSTTSASRRCPRATWTIAD